MLDEKGLIQSVRLHNFLSFGPNAMEKSNLIGASSHARAAGKPKGDWGKNH